ncbi:MAG: cation:proton antiporter, partial [Acidilobaceae archaeon]
SVLLLLSIVMGLAVIAGYLAERARMLPLIGFLAAALFFKTLSELVDLENILGVNPGALTELGFALLTLGGVLIAFEAGREVGVLGFNPKSVYIVALEATIIVVFTVAITRLAGFGYLESVVIVVAILSSSTAAAYKLTEKLGMAEARSLALAVTATEDVALLTGLSLVGGGHRDPVVVLTLTVAFAVIGGAVFRLIFYRIRTLGGQESTVAIVLTLLYASIAGIFASPYLGAFVAGYFFGRATGGEGFLRPLTDMFMLIYMVAVGLLLPAPSSMRLSVLAIIVLVATIAIIVRGLAVFLASLTVLRSGYYATALGVHLSSVSELAPLVAITAFMGGVVSEDLVFALVLLPLISISASNIASLRWERIAGVVDRYVLADVIPQVPESFYRIGVNVVVTSSKVSVILLAVAVIASVLSYIGLWYMGLLALIPAIIIILRLYDELIRDVEPLGKIPAALLRLLTLLGSGSLAFYVIVELSRYYPGFESLGYVAFIGLAILIALIALDTALRLRRALREAVNKMRPPV